MGYAKLNFATTVTTAQAMFDVVRVVTGNVTTTANLSYASTVNSEIVNTLGQNWSVVYGSVADTTTAYVISSSGITAGKTHFAKLQMFSGTAWDASAAFSTAGAGIGINTISSASSATSVTNPTFYSTSTGTTGGGRYVVKTDASNTNIYLHWSANHCCFYGLSGVTGGTLLMGTFECPETTLSQFINTIPVIQFNYFYSSGASFIATTAVGTGTSGGSILQTINLHDPSTSTTSGVYNLGSTGFGTCRFDDFDPVQTYDNAGVQVYPLVPLYWSQPSKGIPIYNISVNSGVYRMAKSASFPEAVFTVGSDSYVWLPMSTTITGGTQEAGIGFIKK